MACSEPRYCYDTTNLGVNARAPVLFVSAKTHASFGEGPRLRCQKAQVTDRPLLPNASAHPATVTTVRIVLIEQEHAKDPMTMVSVEVVEDAKRYGPQHVQWIAQDPSGRNFVHFLLQYALYRPEPIWAGKQILDRPGARMIDFVCQRLNRDAGSLLQKAQWFQAYWNQTVAVHGVFTTMENGVTERYDSGGPCIGMRRMYVPNPPPQAQQAS
jgi:hypothetical protein